MIVGNRNRRATLPSMKSTFTLLLLLAGGLSVRGVGQVSLVNFQHLQHLTERIEFFGDSVDIVHVYSNHPNYKWVDAKESGPEGIACVDDAARAAVFYLREYELNQSRTSLTKATSLLKFVIAMQAEDGQFYNFILDDHSINQNGKTSFKSFGWWAARGVWAMATGHRVLKDVDPTFAAELKSGVELTFQHVRTLLGAYGKKRTDGDYSIPTWLMYESGADVVSELMLGLSEYYAVTQDSQVKTFLEQLADGVMMMQDGDIRRYPYGLHRSWETMWHMWGNGQTQALATVGTALKNDRMIQSAKREARGFYSRLLVEGFFKEMDVAKPGKKASYEQIAYAVRPMAVGLLRLYDATGEEEYLTMAGLASSWLFGNNVLGQTMYDVATGRCFDGIKDSLTVNKNSGAESTIEALITVLEVSNYPAARRFLDFRRISQASTSRHLSALFRNASGDELTIVIDLQQGSMEILEGEESTEFNRLNDTE